MGAALWILAVATGLTVVYWYWLSHSVQEVTMSGDTWYMRQFAFTNDAITAPYCWRPLHPILSRWLGFKTVAIASTLATPFVLYYYLGGGWAACAVSLGFLGSRQIVYFNIKNPEYAEGLGQLVFISSLMAMQGGAPVAWPLLFAAAMCRETLGAALGIIAIVWNPLYLVPIVCGSAAAYFLRVEDKDNTHPLVEKTTYGTIVRYAKIKGPNVLHYAHTVQPVRGAVFAVPFMWSSVEQFARVGLLAAIPIWLLSVPASGQSRLLCYWFAIFAPFVVAAGVEWSWLYCLLCWFWPIDFNVFDESGDVKFGFVK